MTYTEIIRNKNERYTQMTNKELLDAYNASDVYDLTMCKVIVLVLVCTKISITRTAKTLTA